MKFEDAIAEFISLSIDDYVLQDLDRWSTRLKINELSTDEKFFKVFFTRQEYRSLIKYRLKYFSDKSLEKKFNDLFSRFSFSFVQNLFISCPDIGSGFYIEHGFSTVIFAKRIGFNFHVNQCVTIGSGKDGIPTILDNVSIHCNSTVIGGIVLSDNVTVGAGTTVFESVPANTTVVSQRPRLISKY